jgi:hypothetical protein
MDEEHDNSRPRSSRRRLKIAGVAAAALIAVPGGMAISNAFAADGGGTSPTATPSTQATPAQSDGGAPQQRGAGSGAPRGDRGDCPGKDGGDGADTGSASTGVTQQ